MLVVLTEKESDWEFGLCFDYLRNVKDFKWNHKRVESKSVKKGRITWVPS